MVRHKQTGKPTGMVILGYPEASILDEKDYAALTLLDAVMSGYRYPGGWLHSELRGEGLVYWVHAEQLTGPAPGYFTIMAQTQPDTVDEVVARIEKNVARARAGQISEDEVETARKMVIALHAQENTTVGEQALLAAVYDLYGLGYNYDESFDHRMRAVTRDDVIRVARTYLNEHVLVTASPAKEQ
jgi:zinc protease